MHVLCDILLLVGLGCLHLLYHLSDMFTSFLCQLQEVCLWTAGAVCCRSQQFVQGVTFSHYNVVRSLLYACHAYGMAISMSFGSLCKLLRRVQ